MPTASAFRSEATDCACYCDVCFLTLVPLLYLVCTQILSKDEVACVGNMAG